MHQILQVHTFNFASYSLLLRKHKASAQGINESTNFRFLQRLSIIFGFRRDCLWSLASCRDYHPRQIASCRDCLCDSAETLCRKLNHRDSLCRKQEIADSLGGSQIWWTVSAGSINWRTGLYPVKCDIAFSRILVVYWSHNIVILNCFSIAHTIKKLWLLEQIGLPEE